jgi:hypothetical protein
MRVATTSRVINKSSQTPQPERRNIHTLQNESYLSYSVAFERLEKFLPVRTYRVKRDEQKTKELHAYASGNNPCFYHCNIFKETDDLAYIWKQRLLVNQYSKSHVFFPSISHAGSSELLCFKPNYVNSLSPTCTYLNIQLLTIVTGITVNFKVTAALSSEVSYVIHCTEHFHYLHIPHLL